MKYPFRQGIVRQQVDLAGNPEFLRTSALPGNKIDLVADNTPTTVSFAHRNSDYSLSEFQTVKGAWGPFTVGLDDFYLFWDLDLRTGIRTFGATTVTPTFGTSNPSSPLNDQHFFNTVEGQMKVFNATAGTFINKIRVFAGIYRGGATLEQNSTGTQVGINIPVFSGEILFDDSGRGVRKGNGEFFTTEDQFIRNGAIGEPLRLESNVLTAIANENMAAFQIVSFTTFDKVNLAVYEDTEEKLVGIITEDALLGQPVTVVAQGFILNSDFRYTTPNATLFIDNGVLTEVDPNISDPVTHPTPRVPVARVVSQQSIFFLQGLGGTGPRGVQGQSGTNINDANSTVKGITTLSLDPVIAINPIAVGDNDPRNFDARIPVAHTQDATTIVVTPAGDISSVNAQLAFEELDFEKVAKSGAIMTGNLTMSGGSTQIILPNVPLIGTNATNKTYVDSLFGFERVAVATQSDVVAGNATDTLNFIAGTNITITTNSGASSVTFNAAATTTINSLTDADNDTQIQVEESADEDVIRFDTGDTPPGYGAVPDIMTLASSGLTVAMGIANVAATDGAPISLTAGDGNTTGLGGAVIITAGLAGTTATGGAASLIGGAGGITSGAGGDANLTGGNAVGGGTGGNANVTAGTGASKGGVVNITAGNSGGATGDGGAIVITSGAATTSGVGGDVTVSAGNAAGASQTGGSITITAGEGPLSQGVAGNVTITAGLHNSAFDPGGNINIISGAGGIQSNGGTTTIQTAPGGATTGSGGDLIFSTGNATTQGQGGNMSISTGNAVGTGVNGGAITVTTGNGSGTNGGGGNFSLTTGAGIDQPGGDISITAGNSNQITPALATSNGGDISIVAGDSTAAPFVGGGTGGDITLSAGDSAGSKSGGGITLTGGKGGTNADPATGGPILITAGTGGGVSGDGGAVTITGGFGGVSSGNGGDLNAKGGNGNVSGDGGSVNITGGNSGVNFGTGGNIILTPGTGTDANGTITLNSSILQENTITTTNAVQVTIGSISISSFFNPLSTAAFEIMGVGRHMPAGPIDNGDTKMAKLVGSFKTQRIKESLTIDFTGITGATLPTGAVPAAWFDVTSITATRRFWFSDGSTTPPAVPGGGTLHAVVFTVADTDQVISNLVVAALIVADLDFVGAGNVGGTTPLVSLTLATPGNVTDTVDGGVATGATFTIVTQGSYASLVGPLIINGTNDPGAATWDITAEVNDSINPFLDIKVTGEVGKIINWKTRITYITV